MRVSSFRSLSCHSAHTQREPLWLVLSKGISKAWHHPLHSHTNHINFTLYGGTTGQEHKWLQWFCTGNSALLKFEACTCYCLLSLGSHSHPSVMWNSPRQTTASILQNLLECGLMLQHLQCLWLEMFLYSVLFSLNDYSLNSFFVWITVGAGYFIFGLIFLGTRKTCIF